MVRSLLTTRGEHRDGAVPSVLLVATGPRVHVAQDESAIGELAPRGLICVPSTWGRSFLAVQLSRGHLSVSTCLEDRAANWLDWRYLSAFPVRC